MITISVCMIVKDEEPVIRRCLSCVKCFADEIIVIDTGSQDQTAAISREMGALVDTFAWNDDFAAARNSSFSRATKDYIFWLDADDVIDEVNQRKLCELKQHLDPSVDVVMMRYAMAHAKGVTPIVFERERLLKRSCGFHWQGRIHETIATKGTILHSDITICHQKEVVNDPDRNLRIFQIMRQNDEPFSPRDWFYYARELNDHGQRDAAIQAYETFLSQEGWVEDQLQACYDLGVCHLRNNDREQALQAYLRSFSYEVPTSRICNAIGFWFLDVQRYAQAAYWFDQALRSTHRGGFENEDEHLFLPMLELAICYYYLKENELARAWFEAAKAQHPSHSLIIKNEPYFKREQG